ncbi:hypothetical protein VOLCADRAFT_59985, partial [Volvox carteri f. nagariensis]
VRNPALRQVPLGVTQKYLIVTCNYVARAAGVTKLMGIRDAMARCPGLVLVSGEDLGPYRQASKSIHAVLSRYGPAEKLGMDETFVDVTEVRGAVAARGVGNGYSSGAAVGVQSAGVESWQQLLTVGSMVAAEARLAVRSETGFRSSAGISSNKMLAKLVSGLHKPDDQTVLLPDQAWDFVGASLACCIWGGGASTPCG